MPISSVWSEVLFHHTYDHQSSLVLSPMALVSRLSRAQAPLFMPISDDHVDPLAYKNSTFPATSENYAAMWPGHGMSSCTGCFPRCGDSTWMRMDAHADQDFARMQCGEWNKCPRRFLRKYAYSPPAVYTAATEMMTGYWN